VGVHTFSIANTTTGPETDTFDVEVVSAPTAVAFVSLLAPDGTELTGAPAFTINALVQYAFRVKVTTAEDADALTGTGIGPIATGSGLILLPTTVGTAGAGANQGAVAGEATGQVIGEDLGSEISVLVVIAGLLPTEVFTAKVGDPGAASATFSGAVPAAGSIGLLVTGSAAAAADLVTALDAAGCTVESISVLPAGSWLIFINGAPNVVNAAFPAELAGVTPFFVRCAA
jgi:hypothetical protein